MHILLLLAIGGALIFVARSQPGGAPESIPPPPAPPLPASAWAKGFSFGTSIGISGPDASAYGPNPTAAAAAAAPAPYTAPSTLPMTPPPWGNPSAAAMGGASWAPGPVPPAVSPFTVATPAPDPVVTLARRGPGHF